MGHGGTAAGSIRRRGLDISYETVRRWVLEFDPAIARRLRQRRPRPSDRWHLELTRASPTTCRDGCSATPSSWPARRCFRSSMAGLHATTSRREGGPIAESGEGLDADDLSLCSPRIP